MIKHFSREQARNFWMVSSILRKCSSLKNFLILWSKFGILILENMCFNFMYVSFLFNYFWQFNYTKKESWVNIFLKCYSAFFIPKEIIIWFLYKKITKYMNFDILLSGKNLKIIKFRSTKKLIVKSAL